jgi:hypothetical protein
MANPLSGLKPALEVLAQNVDILPATGQAAEDLLRPDQEEVEDSILSREDKRIEVIGERPNCALYVPAPPLPRTERHLFRYFLDGSQRSYFIGSTLERERTSPIHIAQVGTAIVHRRDNGTVHTALAQRCTLLLLARSQLSDGVWKQLEQVATASGLDLIDITEQDSATLPLPPEADLRTRALNKATSVMRRQEFLAARDLAGRGEDDWLVIDGFLRFQFQELVHVPRLIAVAKSFTKEPVFRHGRGPGTETLPMSRLLAGLPAEHRTCVFATGKGNIGFWYVRLREQGEVDYPMMGVIKVETPMPADGEPIDSEQVNILSRVLVAERHVTPHGHDTRWHVHLYPIYLAEQVIKNGFLSQEVVRSAIRWPTLAAMSTRR